MSLAELKVEGSPKQKSIFRNLVVAVDFSRTSRRALELASALAAEHDSQLSVVHVLRTDWRYEMLESPPEVDLERIDADQQLKHLIRNLDSKRKIDPIVLKNGAIPDAILALVHDLNADLLVVGTHGRGGLSKLALGSVAEGLLRSAPCPVMTVGPKSETAAVPRTGYRTVLFATDFGPGSAKALPLAISLASENDSKLVLLHMIPPMPATSNNLAAYAPVTSAADELQTWETSSRNRALRQLRECLPAETRLAYEPEYVVGTDFLPEGVLTAAAQFKADLIVMGANHATLPRIAAHSPWTAVHHILAKAPCPVLTVAG